MRIIVDNGAYTLRNMGDVAMLQALMKRLGTVHPGAECHVLTSAPELLPRYCPGALPLSVEARDTAFLPEEKVRGPGPWKVFWRRVRGKKTGARASAAEFLRVFDGAERLVMAGGGFINDLNYRSSLAILRQVESAVRNGKGTALFGQGLGPLENPTLLETLCLAARAGTWFGLRESLRGPAIVTNAGADPRRVVVTGDDALEAAWDPCISAGHSRATLGFSIRQIDYSGIGTYIECISGALLELKRRLRTSIVPVPVSFNPWEDDPSAITRLTGERCNVPDDPRAIIDAAGQCRVMLTGTYHAAVFALARGTPCVCFHSSPYYRDKFNGLAAQFEPGCAVVDLTQNGAPHQLVAAVDQMWMQSDRFREPLRASAGRQVQTAREFCLNALQS